MLLKQVLNLNLHGWMELPKTLALGPHLPLLPLKETKEVSRVEVTVTHDDCNRPDTQCVEYHHLIFPRLAVVDICHP